TYRNSVFDSIFFFSSRRRHTRFSRDWSSDVCSSDLVEFMFSLLHFKKAGFITCILDEIDEIFPAACQGIRWHMQALFADSAKDFRKANISLFFSIHDLTDLDYRIRSKIQYWGYMKGSTTVTGSLIPRTAPLMLPVGEIMLDRGTYGNVNLGPLQARPRVR